MGCAGHCMAERSRLIVYQLWSSGRGVPCVQTRGRLMGTAGTRGCSRWERSADRWLIIRLMGNYPDGRTRMPIDPPPPSFLANPLNTHLRHLWFAFLSSPPTSPSPFCPSPSLPPRSELGRSSSLLSSDPGSPLIVFRPLGDILLLFFPLPPGPAMAYYHIAPSYSPDFGQATKAGELYLKVRYTLVSTSTMFEGSHQEANPRGLGPPPPNVSPPRLRSICRLRADQPFHSLDRLTNAQYSEIPQSSSKLQCYPPKKSVRLRICNLHLHLGTNKKPYKQVADGLMDYVSSLPSTTKLPTEDPSRHAPRAPAHRTGITRSGGAGMIVSGFKRRFKSSTPFRPGRSADAWSRGRG